MIKQVGALFMLETSHTSYWFQVLPSKHLEHLYYGRKIALAKNADALIEKTRFMAGNMISYSKAYSQLGLENKCLEMSSLGKGDVRETFVEVCHEDGSTTCDFLFDKATMKKGKDALKTLPSSYGTEEEVEQLEIELYDKAYGLRLVLTYQVYADSDVITRSAKLINESNEVIKLNKLMSTQLDFDEHTYVFSHFSGAWAREMNRVDHKCYQGKLVNSSMTGTSSSRSNPFVMLSQEATTEDAGDCYGINLIYSGNHYEAVEVGSFGKLRLVSGINPSTFSYEIASGDSFEAPEAVMTFSYKGFNGMSQNMHQFIRNHIVRGEWQYKERPILLNSWEATYFDINESKLVKMAKAAKEVGIELFVMDDGWFGNRNDDTSSLGDWVVNEKKLPGGLKGIVDKINNLGLDFGIWVEPEMVSEDSECYREHPEWAVGIPGKSHSQGRHQRILDLTREEVQNYIIDAISKVLRSANISYVKWDMNRVFSDYYSSALPEHRQGEFAHRYVLGLYKVLETLTSSFPHILFEGCAAGGNRFDLGMLCYMPQIWASDNTDAIARVKIQTGYSYGYPMSVIGAHVSDCPNHQTLRNTPIETRFNVAAFGLLGYECHIGELSKEDKEKIKMQIAFYKEHRRILQFGKYYRIQNGTITDYVKGIHQCMTVSEDQSKAIGLYLQEQVIPNSTYAKFKTKGLADDKVYHFSNMPLKHNIELFGDLINSVAPIHVKKDSMTHHLISKFVKIDGEKESHIVYGSTLNYAGIKLKQGFGGTGYDEEIRMLQDYHSRIYVMEEVKEGVENDKLKEDS